MHTPRTQSVWPLILASLAVVSLAYGVKNYLTLLVAGSFLCPYLCPSPMGAESASDLPLIGGIISAQVWILESLQGLTATLVRDPHKLATYLIFAPLFEEVLYRGPMYLSRRMRSRWLWWLIGSSLTVVFAFSHGRAGLALLPLIGLGMCSLWLIAHTQRFWPSLTLHFLYNFVFASAMVYQSVWAGD